MPSPVREADVPAPCAETTIRCPGCGIFVLKGWYTGIVEMNCPRCRKAVVAEIRDGKVTVALIDKPKRAI